MLQLGFEPTIPVFEREKTVHPLDREASVMDIMDSFLISKAAGA
jgi:hypothetical protein